MSNQVQLQHNQAKEILKESIANYKYKQQKLKTYSYELTRIKKHLKDLDTINNSAFASYANISFKEEQRAIDSYLQKYSLIQLERLDAYKELIKIMYLIQAESVGNILEYAIEK
jgi:hypothetical protein